MEQRGRGVRSGGARNAPPLVGRDSDLATLRGLLDGVARRGEGRLAVIEGEVGIGKTRLLEEVLAAEEAAALRVLRAGADELGRERPFAPLVEALDLAPDAADAEARELGELISGSGWRDGVTVDAPAVRFRVVESLLARIERLAAEQPLLLAIEDVHWADPSTLLTLHRITQRLTDFSLALIVTCRPYPRPPELAALLAALPDAAIHLRLEALGTDAARTLAAALLEAEAGTGLARELEEAGGNPLFVVELIGALRDEGALREADGRVDVSEPGVPPTLRLTVLRRLSFLREEVLETLRAASALGSSFSVADLALVLERPIPDLLGPLGEAVDAGVLRGDGESLRFRHDLVREAIYEDLAAPLRAGLHLQAARAFAHSGRPAAQAATHFALGAPPGDREAVDWLRRGAEQTAPGAPAVAARFLRRAAELLPDDRPGERALRVELVRSLLWSGELAEAERTARALLAQPSDPEEAAALHYAIGRALAYQGRLEESIEQVERALAETRLAPHDRARLLAEVSHRRLLSGDVAGAARSADEASAHEDAVARWTALCAHAWVAAARGDVARAEELGDQAVTTAEAQPGEPVARIQPRLYRGFVAIDADRLEDAERLLRDGLAVAEELGATWALPLHHAGLGFVHWQAGSWDDAVAEAETSLRLADELDTRVWKPAAHGVIARVAFHRDDLGRAEEVLAEADAERATTTARFWSDGLLLTRALLAEAGGDADAALALLAEHWSWTRKHGSLGDWREVAPQLVRLALARGRPDLAAGVVADLPAASGVALLCRGLADGDTNSLAEAEEALRASARPLENATAAELAARGLDDRERAAALLREAVRIYEELGAARDVARTEAALRERGVRRGSRGPRRRALTGWDSLTPSEHRIASLVAEGLTNPQIAERLFLSRRTVETHVSHALTKLGLSSRVQVAAEAARRGAPPDPSAPTAP